MAAVAAATTAATLTSVGVFSGGNSNITTEPSTNSPSIMIMDEMNVLKLRLWASDTSRHISNQLFYGQLLFSKTQLHQDALLLARIYVQHGQPATAFKLLVEPPLSQQSQQHTKPILHVPTTSNPNPLFWSALEVSVTALSAMEDWIAVQQLIQEITMECLTTNSHVTNPASSGASMHRSESQWIDLLLLPPPSSAPSNSSSKGTKEDFLSAAYPTTRSNNNTTDDRIVASRVWYYRGKAHWELGDPILATEYWMVSLQWDPYNHISYNALLSYQLLTPQQAIELVCQLQLQDDDEWLRALYLAQIPIPCSSNGSTLAAPTNPNTRVTSSSHPKTPLGNVQEHDDEAVSPNRPPASQSDMEESVHEPSSSSSPFYYQPHQLPISQRTSINNLDFGDTSSIMMVSPPLMSVSSVQIGTAGPPQPRRTIRATALQESHDDDENNHHRHNNNNRNNADPSFELGGTTTATRATVQQKNPAAASRHPHRLIQQAFDQLIYKYRLGQSPHVLALAARRAYQNYNWNQCLEYCEQLASLGDLTPSNHPSSSSALLTSTATNTIASSSSSSHASGSASSDAAYCYITVLVLLNRHRTLFQLAHEWVALAPKSPLSWLAVGAYYYATQRYHVAQRHFCRATRLNPQCSPAWMAFGCSFAAVDESDQALASFRAAQRLSPGDPLPLLYMGVEYVRTNHYTLAQYFLQAAHVQSSSRDPLCWHEMGVLEYQFNNLDLAMKCFAKALQLLHHRPTTNDTRSALDDDGMEDDDDKTDWFLDVDRMDAMLSECSDPYWEATIFNLGHAYRKARHFDLAKLCYKRCLALSTSKSFSGSASSSNISASYAALAFATHLDGQVDDAIALYHQALASKPDDPFATELLHRALRESMLNGIVFEATSLESKKPFESQTSPRTDRKHMGRRRPWTRTRGMLGASPLLLHDDFTDHHQGTEEEDNNDDEAGSSDMDSDVDMSG